MFYYCFRIKVSLVGKRNKRDYGSYMTIKSESQLSNDFDEIDQFSEFQPQLPHNNDQKSNLHFDFNGNPSFTVVDL